jgi:hypothetical protein
MDTNTVIPNKTNTQLNNYKGGAFQQSISAVSNTDQICYEQDAQCYSTYGFEYKPGFDGSVRMLVQVSSCTDVDETLTVHHMDGVWRCDMDAQGGCAWARLDLANLGTARAVRALGALAHYPPARCPLTRCVST